ncbi:MAG: hypothetical protein AAGD32_15260 [Planctomycetota bacterium]
MPTYGFTIVLHDCVEATEELADAVVVAGADDATCRSGCGEVALDFDREAPDLETAIRTAVADVAKGNFCIRRIELEAEDFGPSL